MGSAAKTKADTGGKEESRPQAVGQLKALELIRSRRSIREFTGERIPDEHIELILEAARHAPSPENMLMIRLIVIRDDQEMKEFLADIAQEMAQTAFGGAPFELTSGRNWFISDPYRAAVYARLRDGKLFRYPEKSDAAIIVCASESWHDAGYMYQNELFGSVVAGMAISWLQPSLAMVAAMRLSYVQTHGMLNLSVTDLGFHQSGRHSQRSALEIGYLRALLVQAGSHLKALRMKSDGVSRTNEWPSGRGEQHGRKF
jgi:nitroreductase